jgi:hypothetical protein
LRRLHDAREGRQSSPLWVIEVITHSSIAVVVGWPLRQPSPKNSFGSKIPTTASLPCSDRAVSLTLPFQDCFVRPNLGADAKTSSTTRRTGTVAENRLIRSPCRRTRRFRDPRGRAPCPEKSKLWQLQADRRITICPVWVVVSTGRRNTLS